MLHIASYHYYHLVEIHSYQNYFNMSCHWHKNTCYLIRLHIIQKIVDKGANVNVKGEYGKISLHLTYRNNHDGVILILFIVLNLILLLPIFCFIDYKLYNFVWLFANYVNIMWKLYVKRAGGSKCESYNEFGSNPMKMFLKQKTKMKVDHTKKMKILILPHRLWKLMQDILSWAFYVWPCTHFLLLHCGLQSLKCYTTNDAHIVTCVYYVKSYNWKTRM